MRQTNPMGKRDSTRSRRSRCSWIAIGCVLLGQGVMTTASANIYTVGDNTCNYTTIAGALAAAESHAGADTIRLTRSVSYNAQAINFTTSQDLTITGGFANCTTTTEDATYTILNGAGAPAASVITINGNPGSVVRMRKLTIKNGDVPSNGTAGGGIQYTGKGRLDIAYTLITNNTGANGGGIRVDGVTDAAELDIGPNTQITTNTAYYNGGGIYSNNLETAIRGEGIAIYGNEAQGVAGSGGLGGGIHIRACAEKSIVYLASPGVGGNLTVVSNNNARYGGGVAIETPSGCSNLADLRMYSNAAGMTRLYGNTASISGGGVYMFRGGGPTNVYVSNASIQNNTAPVAAALYLGNAGNATFNVASSNVDYGDDLVPCAVGVPCGSISGNISTNGQVIYGESSNEFRTRLIEITGNQGSELIRVNDLNIDNTLIANNSSSNRLLESHNGLIARSTLVGNQVGGPQVIGINTGGSFTMFSAVTWQPGKTILHNDGALAAVYNVITNELASLSGSNSFNNLVANPRLIDPLAGGDYRPTAGSPLVDYAGGNSLPYDLLGLPRAVDLELVANRFGAVDVGAYERQAMQPLVENGEFPTNVRVWTIFNGTVASYDSTQNAPDSTGGSMHIKQTTTSPDVVGAAQCVHLPGPGDYTLNGSGKVASGGSLPSGAHYATVGWELRLAGSENCTGNPDAYGDKVVASTGNAWNRPATPAHILVTAQQFTSDTSVLVYLKINEGGGVGGIDAPNGSSLKEGWIDHVTLSVEEPVSDRIFFDGFDPASFALPE